MKEKTQYWMMAQLVKGEALESAARDYYGASLRFYATGFPKGYGYALYADGSAGPSVALGNLQNTLDKKRKTSQVNVAALAKLLANQ